MDSTELTALLKNRNQQTKRGWRCPDDNDLAAYVSKTLDENRRQKLEIHFADCQNCLEALAFVASGFDDPSADSVPAHLITRARALTSSKSVVVWRWGWATAGAAACLLIVFGLMIWKSRPPQTPTNLVVQNIQSPPAVPTPEPKTEVPPRPTPSVEKTTPAISRAPVLRGPQDELKPTLISPRDGSVFRNGIQTVRWKPIAEATFYEVKVITEDGGAVVSESTTNTQFQVNTATLEAGAKYFLRVDAHLNSGRTIRSDLVSFRIAGK